MFSTTHPHLFDNSLFRIEEGIEEVSFEDLALVHERVLDPTPTTLTPPTVQAKPFTGISRKSAPERKARPRGASDGTLVATNATALRFSTTNGTELPGGQTIELTTKATQVAHPVHSEPMIVERETVIATAEPEPATIPAVPPPLFCIDTDPSSSQTQITVPAYDIHLQISSLGGNGKVEEPDSEDDVIVYDAPNPRIFTPKVEPSTLASISPPKQATPPTPRQINPVRRGKFVHVVGRNVRRGSGGMLGVKRKRLSEHKNFAAFGAMIAEARLRTQVEVEDEDPKQHLRRQGDSDLDWGDETGGSEKENHPVVATAEGMDLDPDLVGSGVTMAAMESFVEGVNGNHVTMDDLKGAIAKGDSPSDGGTDEDEDEDGSDSEDLENDEEMMLIEEFLADQYGSDFSEDEDDEEELDPRAGFQARLDRLRKKQQKIIDMEDYEDEDEDEMDPKFQWGEGEEIDVCMIRNSGSRDLYSIPRTLKVPWIHLGRIGRRATRSSGPFRTMIHSLKLLHRVGGWSCRLVSSADNRAERKDLPAELLEQWEKDRLKKARKKEERELARLEAALDPLVTKKSGNKSKKAMRTAAKLDPSIEMPHQIVDMVLVEQQIRRFLADKHKTSMALPACNKRTRWNIHTLAPLFGLTSKSKGGAGGRYTTLFKDEQSGKNIDERKVSAMVQQFEYRALYDVSDDDWDDVRKGKGKGKGKGKAKAKGKGKGKKVKGESGHMKTREGDVVGHVRAWFSVSLDSC